MLNIQSLFYVTYTSKNLEMKYCHLCKTWIDLESNMLNEISQVERKELYDFTHMWLLKQNNTGTNKITQRLIRSSGKRKLY